MNIDWDFKITLEKTFTPYEWAFGVGVQLPHLIRIQFKIGPTLKPLEIRLYLGPLTLLLAWVSL